MTKIASRGPALREVEMIRRIQLREKVYEVDMTAWHKQSGKNWLCSFCCFCSVIPTINTNYCQNFTIYHTNELLATNACTPPANDSTPPYVVNLAVMIPAWNKSEWRFGYSIQMTALIAQWQINYCSPLAGGFVVNATFFDSGCNQRKTAQALAEVYRLDYRMNFHGIVGPGCSDGAVDVARVVRHFDLGMVSYGAEDAELSQRSIYPLFFRTSFSGDFYKFAWLKVIDYFKWTRVATVRGSDRLSGVHTGASFTALFRSRGGTVVYEYSQPERVFNESLIIDELLSHKARVVVTLLTPRLVLKLMCVAYKMKVRFWQGHSIGMWTTVSSRFEGRKISEPG